MGAFPQAIPSNPSEMNTQKPFTDTCSWKKSLLWLALAVACFHGVYTSLKYPAAGLLIFGYAYALVRLVNQPTVRRAFYFGLATGFLCDAPQLFFFWQIFSIAAIVLWIVAGFWIGLFAAISCGCIKRWGRARAIWLIPIIWTGTEYFRSELYFLKFSWLNIGYALPWGTHLFGMYGIGFVVVLIAVTYCHLRPVKVPLFGLLLLTFALAIILHLLLLATSQARTNHHSASLNIVGIQMEFPPANIIPKVLSEALAKNTNAQIFVLSEYTLDGGVPDALKTWCHNHARYLIVGGKDIVTNDVYYNTAFVVGTNGDIIFKQAKSVPIQFFHDGLPARKQDVWESPFGKIGICICYDLSYTRITDEFVREGAQIIIAPTMDVSDWGRHEHELHSRVAPVRAAEYGIPIFRLASSGISQAVQGNGHVVANTSFDTPGEVLHADLRLPPYGSLPLDRFLAPVCTALTIFILTVLLLLWRNDCRSGKSSP